jgi:hypothetical protein
MTMPDFDHLYAMHLSYSDIYTDEYIIIQKLKEELSNIEPDTNLINNHLINFYNLYNITITPEILNSINDVDIDNDIYNDNDIKLEMQPLLSTILEPGNVNIYIDPQINYIPVHSTPNNFNSNIYNQLVNMLSDAMYNYQPPDLVDVVSTLAEEEYDKINNYEQKDKSEICCSICMCEPESGEMVSELPCHHLFHKECIYTYLKEYHHICPVCRAEVGKRKE